MIRATLVSHFTCLALLLTPACTGLETGNGITTLTAALTVGDGPVVDANGAAFTLTTARASVRRIDLSLPPGTSCVGLPGLVPGAEGSDSVPYTNVCKGSGDEIRLNGPWIVDLVAGTSSPALPKVNVPAGVYRRVDVRFDDADPDDGLVAPTDLLADHTLVATGTVPLGGTAQPFRLRLDFSEDARFEAAGGLALSDDAAASVLLELDPSAWFATLPLARCAEDGDLTIADGVLLLEDDRGSCSAIENAVKDAIKASGELRRRD